MLFNSHEFIFLFLPLVFTGFFLIGKISHEAAAGWLCLASLLFYASWQLSFVPLLIGSILFNYAAGRALCAARADAKGRIGRLVLFLAVAVNLIAIGVFKYASFLIGNCNWILALFSVRQLHLLGWALPIGISFYTFTQIAFLADCHAGKVTEPNFLHYALFVTYFPHLIAGPIVHHKQLMPQFGRPEIYEMQWSKIGQGLLVFTVGLAKKIFIADALGTEADRFFDGVGGGGHPSFNSSWIGVLAFALQIYFDFSGYCQMAVGISLLFGISLPNNFATPYRSTSIIEFWRRWHITLSAFLRDYLYIPLGGNRKGPLRRYVNLLVTMLLGGLWHGASWTFVFWGLAHGLLLLINHLWRSLGQRFLGARWRGLPRPLGWLLTFVPLCFTWVLFRSGSLRQARRIAGAMLDFGSLQAPHLEFLKVLSRSSIPELFNARWVAVSTNHPIQPLVPAAVFVLLALAGSLLEPDPSHNYAPALQRWVTAPRRALVPIALGCAAGCLLGACLGDMAHAKVFIYFQF
jgi:alginate O-acetyltransferase complex protein AlgI